MIIGFIIRQWSITILGCFFLPTVGVKKDHKLIDSGPYKLIRHPSYTGSCIFLIGLGLTLQSWGTVIIAIIIISIAYGYRIHIEENILISKFGDEYIKYMKRTKKIIPYIL
ncbi:MAG: isoprenylcysteine carboxylmethyltransferase family protein [Methanobacterium sp.]|nr:isoprenylcysteine carboxylmethyltransferase family protein [Methanobacterium sp.]